MLKSLRYIFTFLLVALVLYMAGVFDPEKRAELLSVLSQPDWFWLLICVLVGFLVNLSSAVKWWMLARAANLKVGLLRCLAYYLIGMFYNLILPTSVGGDVVRAFELGKYTQRKAKAMASVFVERYSGVVVLWLLSVIAVIVNARTFNVPAITYSLAAFSVALGMLGWLAFDGRVLFWFKQRFAHWHSFIGKIFAKVEKLHEAVVQYKGNKNALSWAFINSMIFYGLAILNVYTTARVFTPELDFMTIVVATPVIMLMMNIPLSIGNHGIMEAAFTITFEILGLGSILGLSTALLIRLKSIVDGAIGASLHPYFSTVSASELKQSD